MTTQQHIPAGTATAARATDQDRVFSASGPAAETRSRGWACGLAALAAGLIFGLGLGVADMVDPLKVLGFLDVAGAWDASLMFVLGGAVSVAALGYRLVLRRPWPRLADRFHVSARRDIDAPLVVGAALFGIGWGLVGYCPGPAIASIGFANPEALWFVPAMLAGAALQRWRRSASLRHVASGDAERASATR
ncbi:MAG: hypothetical protein RL375_1637 [Pseudomonadota bacterium]